MIDPTCPSFAHNFDSGNNQKTPYGKTPATQNLVRSNQKLEIETNLMNC
jgi:hypothetical protein